MFMRVSWSVSSSTGLGWLSHRTLQQVQSFPCTKNSKPLQAMHLRPMYSSMQDK